MVKKMIEDYERILKKWKRNPRRINLRGYFLSG
jgi:hypothetical protein